MVQHALAVFDCEDADKWHGHEQLYISRFGGPGANWDAFKCWDGQLPDLAAAAQYRAIFITGSHYSAYEDLPWISNLVAWLHSFVMGASCATKIVAVCFGSQVIARALGGKIGKNASGRFVLTVEDLSLQMALREKRYFKAAVQAGDHSPEACHQLKVLDSHGDQVLELPEGAELLATSPTALNEIWTYQDRVLAIQGHPEMPCKEALHKILPFLSSNGRLSEEEAAASKRALENVEPDWVTIQRIMEEFIKGDAEISPVQGVEPAATGYSSWLPSMTLPTMPGMPGMSLPSVSMPSMSLPSLSLPDWIPLGPYSSSPMAAQHAKADGSADSSSTAEQIGKGLEAAKQSTLMKGDEPAAPSGVSAEASTSVAHEEEHRTQSLHVSAPADSISQKAENSSLPVSTHATGVHGSMAERGTAQPSGSGDASRVVEKAEPSSTRISSLDDSQSSSTSAKAEDFLEHVSRAVVAELDGALCDMQLLFGVNTVARAEFQRILQELLHWGPLVEDMKRKQEQCMPKLKAMDVMEERMDRIEAAIKALDQQTRKLVDSA